MLLRFKPAQAGLLLLAATISEANAASVVTVTPVVPHPSQTITVTGSGFANSEAVDLYLDTTDVLLLVSSSTGTFTATLSVPAGAQPGKHYATAIGRRSTDAAQIAYTVTTPWAELGYGHAHYSVNPYENTLNTGNVASLGLLWGTATGAIIGGPAVVSGKVFTAGNGISALSTTTGAVLWSVDTTDSFYGTPAVSNAVVYVASIQTDNLYAVATSNGAKKWTTVLGSATGGTIYSSPMVANGVVYVGSYDDKLYAIQAGTTGGGLKWSATTSGLIYGSPSVAGNQVIIGSEDGYVYSYNLRTGILQWDVNTGAAVDGTATIANGVAYISNDAGDVLALNPSYGGILGSISAPPYVVAPIAVSDGVLYFTGEYTKTYAYALNSGLDQVRRATHAPAISSLHPDMSLSVTH
jgi:outer membrane protein assembly factor BamB